MLLYESILWYQCNLDIWIFLICSKIGISLQYSYSIDFHLNSDFIMKSLFQFCAETDRTITQTDRMNIFIRNDQWIRKSNHNSMISSVQQNSLSNVGRWIQNDIYLVIWWNCVVIVNRRSMNAVQNYLIVTSISLLLLLFTIHFWNYDFPHRTQTVNSKHLCVTHRWFGWRQMVVTSRYAALKLNECRLFENKRKRPSKSNASKDMRDATQ